GGERKLQSRYCGEETEDSCFFFSSRRRHTRSKRDWSSDVCSSDLADGEEAADHDCAENALAQVRSDSEDVRQIAVDFINQTVVVPGLPRPKPLPSGATNKSADEDHGNPQDDETEEKSSNGEFALLPGVVARAQWIGVDIGNHHQAKYDESGHDHAGDPGVEVNQHFLQ